MICFPTKDEDALSDFWLLVWHNLVEMHWDLIATEQEQNDPYGDAHYSFRSLRSLKCRSKESIDEDVATLAQDYWKRNRSSLKEYFINYTIDFWPDHATYDVLQAVEGIRAGEWIDCGEDPAYPNRRSEHLKWDAKQLDEIGWFKATLEKAIRTAKQQQNIMIMNRFRVELLKEKEEKRQCRAKRVHEFKRQMSSFLHNMLSRFKQ